MITPEEYRIAGLQAQDDGVIAVVWLAHDRTTDRVQVYDAVKFSREVLAVVAEGINARGRWIPVAWHKDAKEIADQLLEKHCKMQPEPVQSSQPAIEAVSLSIWERMRSHRLKADKRLGNWVEEFKTYNRQKGQVPTGSHPLMDATRNAICDLKYARRQAQRRGVQINYPRLAMV